MDSCPSIYLVHFWTTDRGDLAFHLFLHPFPNDYCCWSYFINNDIVLNKYVCSAK